MLHIINIVVPFIIITNYKLEIEGGENNTSVIELI